MTRIITGIFGGWMVLGGIVLSVIGVSACWHGPLGLGLGLVAVPLSWGMAFEGGEMVAAALMGEE